MNDQPEYRHLVKFLVVSAVSFFIGTIQGMLQVLPPIRRWLDSIGSPSGFPGHMIDPLAHAHINLVGGVVTLAMGTTYYLLPIFSGRRIFSLRLVDHTLLWTALGQFYFYLTLIVFGLLEGIAFRDGDHKKLAHIDYYYHYVIAGAGIVMAIGFAIYLLNIVLTLIKSPGVQVPDA